MIFDRHKFYEKILFELFIETDIHLRESGLFRFAFLKSYQCMYHFYSSHILFIQ